MRYFEHQYDSDEEWKRKLADLAENAIPTEEIPGVIVRLGKPFKSERILAAKEVILGLAHNENDLVRSQVVWFCRWGKLTETVPLLRAWLSIESEEHVREEIEHTLSYLSAKTKRKAV